MLGAHFYNQAIKKTVVGFGTLFNNLTVVDVDPQDPTNILGKQKVGLAYAPKEKFLTRLEENPDLSKTSIVLPRMYFEMTGISYDGTRKLGPTQKHKTVVTDNNDEVRVQFIPVPYNMEFELGILARNQDDGLQLLEQIVPYFQPHFNITINFIPEMNEKKDVQLELSSIDYSDEWDGNFNQRRYLTWTLRFNAKSYIYGPFNTADLIKKAIIYEGIGDPGTAQRSIKRTYTPKALTDTTSDPAGPSAGAPDGVIDSFDDAALSSFDDFGFNSITESV